MLGGADAGAAGILGLAAFARVDKCSAGGECPCRELMSRTQGKPSGENQEGGFEASRSILSLALISSISRR